MVCPRCLHRNDLGVTFCASCGAYLEWSQGGADRPKPPAAARTAKKAGDVTKAPRRRPAAPVARSKTGRPGADGREGGGSDPGSRPGGGGAGPRGRSRTPGPPPGLTGEDAELAWAAERLLDRLDPGRERPADAGSGRRISSQAGPGDGGDPDGPGGGRTLGDAADGRGDFDLAGRQPQAQKPAEEQRVRVRATPVADDFSVHAGEMACPSCGAGNGTGQFYCRRCGVALRTPDAEVDDAAAIVEAGRRRRWWQFWRRRDEIPETSAEPPSRKLSARRAAPVAAVLLAILSVLGPFRGRIANTLDSARTRVAPSYVNVYAAEVTASAAIEDHPAESAVDRAPNTYWAVDNGRSGVEESLTVTFDRPVHLRRIGFTNGAQTKPQDFLSQPRLREVQVTFDSAKTETIRLDDRDAFQTRSVNARDVTTLTIRIRSVYPSPLGGTAASLGEVEFFTRS